MVENTTLPPCRPDQTFATVSPIEGGFITLPDRFFVAPADPEAKRTVPSLSFLITHPGLQGPGDGSIIPHKKPLRLLFDLGLRSSIDRYIPGQQKHLRSRVPYRLEPGVAEHLRAQGIEPTDVDVIMFSHVHYDHHGDPEDFPRATFIVGPGSLDVLAHGLSGMGSHQHFDPDLLPKDRTVELPPTDGSQREHREQNWTWTPLGPFPAALDLLGDESVYVINTPGHLPGHINLLCRISPDKWVCLCGDAYHDPRLLTGEKDIGTWESEEGRTLCIHLDRRGAEESIGRLRQLAKLEQVELIAAHDDGWLEKNRNRMFPSVL